MKPLDATESKSLLKAITNPKIAKFIDINKLKNSKEFELLFRWASSHAKITGDTGPISRILHIFEGTKHLNDIGGLFRSETDLLIYRQNGIIHVKKKSNANINVKLDLAIPDTPKKAPYIDALDHPARLPGSYGTGKRR